jgi:oligopeptide transport system substrate-binding protein
MKPSSSGNKSEKAGVTLRRTFTFTVAAFCLSSFVFLSACTELEKPAAEPFFTQTNPPKKQEFRWSNGKLPKSFDPATASAPPETDVVRAIFEGLTETDPKTLEEVSGVAESWAATDNFKIWTFNLRKDAKWTNGKPVVADDFVRSWKRLIAMGRKAAHGNLLNNIFGVPTGSGVTQISSTDEGDLFLNSAPTPVLPNMSLQQLARPTNSNANSWQLMTGETNSNSQTEKPGAVKPKTDNLGIVAESEHVLKVTLISPDKDFPKLVANPIFRPVYGDADFTGKELNASVVTNGPFKIVSVDSSGIVLDRSDIYWNRDKVKLERVHFVPMENAEKALAAYRAGELDAVTNADFAPLVLKLLSPYDDFRRTTHSALNLYDINSVKPPFSDRRVRQALSNAIEREKLTEGEMEGVTRPALSFFPFGTKTKLKLSQDKEKAKELLDEAGFPDGKDFPVIKLLINRNDTQQRVARSVAKMWKQNLNLETEIIIKEAGELELARKAGEFDLLRRGVVLPTADEAVNFMAIFDGLSDAKEEQPAVKDEKNRPTEKAVPELVRNDDPMPGGDDQPPEINAPESVLSEEDALYELRAIPLYFPTSFSLVRPYVVGFEMNSLDALTLSNVAIDSEWRPKKAIGDSK